MSKKRADLMDDFAVLILTHGRPDNVITYDQLRHAGYTGRIVIVIDNEDKTADQYHETFPGEVEVFDKAAIAKTFDEADNFQDRRAIIYARNASFDIAERLGIRYFMQCDDDYYHFSHRFRADFTWSSKVTKNLDNVFRIMLEYFHNATRIDTLAFAQGGDFIGGGGNRMGQSIALFRKCMNTFLCDTKRRFQFVGRINEDVNTYTHKASTGLFMATFNQFYMGQTQTQQSTGGMSDIYLDRGTYVKSFYSVIFMPSAVKISPMGEKNMRLHHSVSWDNAVPLLISEEHRKGRKPTKKKRAELRGRIVNL